MLRIFFIAALVTAPLPALANSDAISAIEAALQAEMGSLPDVESTHDHPAHGQAMTCHHYAVPGGTIEAIGATEGLSNAGALTLVTTDVALTKALADQLQSAIGTPKSSRGRDSKVWDVATKNASFSDQTSIVMSQDGQTLTLQLERRRPTSDPMASLSARPAARLSPQTAPDVTPNLDPTSNWAAPGYQTPRTRAGLKTRDD